MFAATLSATAAEVFTYIGYILLALVGLMIMITVHEFGHYLAGRLLGFKIEEFSIGFGPAFFKRKSKKTGQLFSAIVKRLRMETACHLLHNDRLTVKEIAYKVGYSSAEQFSRTFRDYYLMSPGAYRKSTGLV